MKKRIKAFGCSLTAQHHWQYMFNDDIDYTGDFRVAGNDAIELESYAIGSGSNDMQFVQYINEVYHGNILSDDIIVWQITSPHRRLVHIDNIPGTHMSDSNGRLDHDNGYIDVPSIFKPEHIIQGKDLSTAQHHNLMPPATIIEAGIELYTLLLQLNGVKRDNNKLLVLFGWDDIFESPYEKQNVMQFLQDRGIDYLEESILEWSVENNYNTMKTFHPEQAAYIAYTREVLVPKLKSLESIGWL